MTYVCDAFNIFLAFVAVAKKALLLRGLTVVNAFTLMAKRRYAVVIGNARTALLLGALTIRCVCVIYQKRADH